MILTALKSEPHWLGKILDLDEKLRMACCVVG